MRCLLVDDELPGLQYLKSLCLSSPQLEVVAAYNAPQKVVDDLHKLQFDLAFIDIEMPGMNGLDLARRLGKPVIFTTAYKAYAADAFEIDAIDYLVKPINGERFRKAVEKAASLFANTTPKNTNALFNTDRGKMLIDFNELLLIETQGNEPRDKHVLTKEGTEIILKNYSFQTLKQLVHPYLVQINKRQMVSVKAVQSFTSTVVIVNNNNTPQQLSLNSIYREDFLKTIEGGSLQKI